MESIFINAYGTILEFPVGQNSWTLSQLVNNSGCPLWGSFGDASSAGSAYNKHYSFQSHDRNNLMDEAGDDIVLWGIIFFLDSVSAKT